MAEARATQKQLSYLKALRLRKGLPVDGLERLTRQEASREITRETTGARTMRVRRRRR